MASSFPPPLGGPPPAEIPLARAPLERVLTQVRFPPILRIAEQSFIASFQESIRDRYPLLEQEAGQVLQISITPGGPAVAPRPNTIWRFSDAEQHWRVSLTSDFITLEAMRYTSRTDFLQRWTHLLKSTEAVINPRIALRLGLRYVDRIKGDAYKNVDKLINKRVLGAVVSDLRPYVRHAFNEAAFAVEEGDLLLRFGLLPAGATPDPTALEPIGEPSFILDIDISTSNRRDFLTDELAASFRKFAERAYSIFRFVVTDEFLLTYGSEV